MPFSSGSSPRRPTYSLWWAEGVIKDVARKYPRGLKFWEQFTRLSREHLAFILARNNGEWHSIRLCIKNIERIYDIRDNYHHDDDYLAFNLYCLMETFEKNAMNSRSQTFAAWAEGLTARRISIILEEPDEKGGVGRSESDESPLPSLFRREAILDRIRRREAEARRKDTARRKEARADQ